MVKDHRAKSMALMVLIIAVLVLDTVNGYLRICIRVPYSPALLLHIHN